MMSRTINQSKMFDYLGTGNVDLRYTPDLTTTTTTGTYDENLDIRPERDTLPNYEYTLPYVINLMYNVILIQFITILILTISIAITCIKLVR